MTSLFVCQMLFLATIVIFRLASKSQAKEEIIIKAKALGRHRQFGIYYGNFVLHRNIYLAVSKVILKKLIFKNLKTFKMRKCRSFCKWLAPQLNLECLIVNKRTQHQHCSFTL